MTKQNLNQKGSTLLLYTVAMVAMMGMAALAIDLGFLRKARAEAQRAADGAALAGASAFQEDISAAAMIDSARTRAYRYADTNYMNGVKFDTAGGEVTVWVIPDSQKVRVRARRASVPTWFARVFGLNSLPVGAIAAAEASESGSGAACVKPIAIPDLWDDTQDGGFPNGNHVYDPGETWLYQDGVDTYAAAHTGGDGLGTGLGSDLRNDGVPFLRDWGRVIVMRPSVSEGEPNQPCPGDLQGNKCYVPGWWGLWGGNTPDMRDMIEGCASGVVSVGVTEPTESGWRQTLNSSVQAVYNRDPGARWDASAIDPYNGKTGSIVGSQYLDYRSSPRMWTMAMVHPSDVPMVPSDHDTQFNNFMVFFLEGCMDESGTGPIGMPCGTQSMLIGRFMGKAQGVATGPTHGTQIKMLRLVE
jgi:hypothetical protein